MAALALPKYFSTWAVTKHASGTGRARHDYDCPDHLLEEMMHEAYFAGVIRELQAGDFVWVTDGASQMAVLRIDHVDANARTVGVSLIERMTAKPVVGESGYAVRNRGPRGGFWCVIDKDGTVVARDMRTEDEAKRAMHALISGAKAA